MTTHALTDTRTVEWANDRQVFHEHKTKKKKLEDKKNEKKKFSVTITDVGLNTSEGSVTGERSDHFETKLTFR